MEELQAQAAAAAASPKKKTSAPPRDVVPGLKSLSVRSTCPAVFERASPPFEHLNRFTSEQGQRCSERLRTGRLVSEHCLKGLRCLEKPFRTVFGHQTHCSEPFRTVFWGVRTPSEQGQTSYFVKKLAPVRCSKGGRRLSNTAGQYFEPTTI